MAVTWPIDVLLRSEKGSPISAVEFDDNLTTLQDASNELNDRVSDIENGTTTVPNADKLDGADASSSPAANQIPILNSNGQLNLPFYETPILVDGQPYTRRTFYVDATNGSDSNSGTSSAPFASLTKALNSAPDSSWVHIIVKSDISISTLNQPALNRNGLLLIIEGDDSILGRKPQFNFTENRSIFISGNNIRLWFFNIDSTFSYSGLSNSVYGLFLTGSTLYLGEAGFMLPALGLYNCSVSISTDTDQYITLNGYCNYLMLRNNTSISYTNSTGNSYFRLADANNCNSLYIESGVTMTINGTSTTAWSNYVNGIIRDGNNTPRNILSNVIL